MARSVRGLGSVVLSVGALSGLGACGAAGGPSASEPAVAASEPRQAEEPPAYEVPVRTPEELAHDLQQSCERAQGTGRAVLLEFGAAWCGDCRRLTALEQKEPLASELSEWERVQVNVTDPEVHEELMTTFGVRAVAHWEALVPDSCSKHVDHWVRVGSRTVEPKRGDTRAGEDLARWLSTTRRRAAELR